MNVFYLQIVHLSIRPKKISFTLFLEAVPRELPYLSGQNSNSYRLKHNTDQYFMSLDVL